MTLLDGSLLLQIFVRCAVSLWLQNFVDVRDEIKKK
jgi:hypothetical protein